MSSRSWWKSLRYIVLSGTLLLPFAATCTAAIQSSASYGLTANILSTSGGESSSASYSLRGALGQWSATGQASSSSYRLSAGFFQSMPITSVPVITTPDTVAFTYGTAGSFTVATTGAPLPAVSHSGPLPAGITFTDNGNGSATIAGTPLEVGTYPLTMIAANGNSPAAVQPFILTVARGTAAISIGNLNQTYDGTARVATVTTTPPGLAVTVTYNGGADIPVNAGSYTVTATVTGPNYQGSASGVLTVSRAAQTITFAPLTDRRLGDPDFAPGASATSGLAVTYTSSDPAVATVVNGSLHLTGTGSSTITASQAGDGNYSAAPPVTRLLTVGAATPPQLILSAVADGAVVSSRVLNISGSAVDPGGIEAITINGSPARFGPDGSFSFPVQLLAGDNAITIVVTGNGGRTTTVIRHVTLDYTAPLVTVSPSDNSSYSNPLLDISGTVTGTGTLVTWMVNDGAPQAAAMNNNSFSFIANLALGMNTIEIIATDLSGRSSRVKRTVTYAPPFTLVVSDPASDAHVATSSYLLTGTVSGNTSPVTVTISVNGTTFTPTVVNGLFQQEIRFNGNGIYQVIVTGTDQSGNVVATQRNFMHVDPALDGTHVTIIDALQALQMAVGIITPDSGQVLRMDVAPLSNGVSVGNGRVDIEDALVILYLVVGLI